MKTRLRITIEGQGGAAGNQLANVIAGMVQLAGYPTVHITDTATGYSSERGGLEVDAQIVVKPLEGEALAAVLLNDDQSRRVFAAEEKVKQMVELLKYYADEYRIAEDSGELQHWPDSEVNRCKVIAELLREDGQ